MCNLCDMSAAASKVLTCLLFQVLTAPKVAMLLCSVSRRLFSSSGDSAVAILPS